MMDAKPRLDRNGGGGKRLIRRRGRQHDQIDRLSIDFGVSERGLSRMHGQIGGEFTWRCNAALVDSGALDDPLVRGIDLEREIAVGEHLARQVTAASEYDRTPC